MKKMYIIRNIILSFGILILLIATFFQNPLFEKVIILPFVICSLAFLCENIFLLLNKIEISNIFKKIFNIVFWMYVIGFLAYMVYYSITSKSYPLLIVVALFLLFTICIIKRKYFNKK